MGNGPEQNLTGTGQKERKGRSSKMWEWEGMKRGLRGGAEGARGRY
jgi:hypothetical protein